MGLPGPKGFAVSKCWMFNTCHHRIVVSGAATDDDFLAPDFQGDAGKIGEAGSSGAPGQRASYHDYSYTLTLFILHNKS